MFMDLNHICCKIYLFNRTISRPARCVFLINNIRHLERAVDLFHPLVYVKVKAKPSCLSSDIIKPPLLERFLIKVISMKKESFT